MRGRIKTCTECHQQGHNRLTCGDPKRTTPKRQGWRRDLRLPSSTVLACVTCGEKVTLAKASQHAWEKHGKAMDQTRVREEFRRAS